MIIYSVVSTLGEDFDDTCNIMLTWWLYITTQDHSKCIKWRFEDLMALAFIMIKQTKAWDQSGAWWFHLPTPEIVANTLGGDFDDMMALAKVLVVSILLSSTSSL